MSSPSTAPGPTPSLSALLSSTELGGVLQRTQPDQVGSCNVSNGSALQRVQLDHLRPSSVPTQTRLGLLAPDRTRSHAPVLRPLFGEHRTKWGPRVPSTDQLAPSSVTIKPSAISHRRALPKSPPDQLALASSSIGPAGLRHALSWTQCSLPAHEPDQVPMNPTCYGPINMERCPRVTIYKI